MHFEQKHALLSASGAKRWMTCTPSAMLEAEFENTTSSYAEEGTFMHSLAELLLSFFLGKTDRSGFTRKFDRLKQSPYYSDEISDAVRVYVDYTIEKINEARAKTTDACVLIEQRLDFSEWVDGGFGTGDTVIVSDDILDVIDLKGGKGVSVSAEKNPQLMLYALGALELFGSLYNIQRVRMTICQPRLDNISVYEIGVYELLAWAENELRPKAQLAANGKGEFVAGDHCRFCRARKTCRARADQNLRLAQYEFKRPSLLTDEEVADVLALADQVATWASDVWAYATETAINQGKRWTGLKLVEGRSIRKYTDEKAVTNAVLDAGFTEKEIFKQSLLGITDMEKLLGKKRFEDVLSGLVEKPKGKPTLVPTSDKRQELSITAAADFEEAI